MGFAWPPNFFSAPLPDDGFDGDTRSFARQQHVINLHRADDQYGYLHTHVTTKELSLYITGMAAAKTNIDPMDADVLLNSSFPPSRRFVDYVKATSSSGSIYGFLRMEAGFEIILCSFEIDIDEVRITADPLLSIKSNQKHSEAISSHHGGNGKDIVGLVLSIS
ncbi:hypothetical protein KEM54_000359 [Ascosphaera aggregata]|nr:hypothetical protein KEM54_000359 [Ascosphaera aggregata]